MLFHQIIQAKNSFVVIWPGSLVLLRTQQACCVAGSASSVAKRHQGLARGQWSGGVAPGNFWSLSHKLPGEAIWH